MKNQKNSNEHIRYYKVILYSKKYTKIIRLIKENLYKIYINDN